MERKELASHFSTKPTKFQNLDVIISVGCIVKVTVGTQEFWMDKKAAGEIGYIGD